MTAPIYLGDEASAAGWRLAGIDARVPPPGGEAEAFAAARAQAPLVIVSADVAARLGAEAMGAALAALAPLTLVVPDLAASVPLRDIAREMRGELGLESAP